MKKFPHILPLVCLFLSSCIPNGALLQDEAPKILGNGLLGGGNTGLNTPIAYTFDLETGEPVPITGLPSSGEILSVAIDVDGKNGIIGGFDLLSNSPIAYVVDIETSAATQITGLGATDGIVTSAISESGTKGIIAGGNGPEPIAYTIPIGSPSATPITLLPPTGAFLSSAINTDGTVGLLGGGDLTSGFAYKVNLEINTATSLNFVESPRFIQSVAIDSAGTKGLLGAEDLLGGLPLAYSVDGLSSSALTFPTTVDSITSVAINRAGTVGLLGGTDLFSGSPGARAYTLDMSTGGTAPLEIPGLAADAIIRSVAIDTLGEKGLLGGDTISATPIAYVVDIATKTATAIPDIPTGGTFLSVEIQDLGEAGLLGGQDGSSMPIAYLVTGIKTGTLTATQLPLSGAASPGIINSVSFDSLIGSLSQIKTRNLSGNNRTLAEYINQNAPNTASYFLPATLAGKLNSALESASPARNAATLFSSDNTFFSVAQGISRRSRDARQFRRFEEKEKKELALVAANTSNVTNCPCENRLNNLWGEVIGLVAHQDRQNETPGFDPWSVGALLAYDMQKTKNFRGGLGLAYAYTSLDFDKGNGNSNVNQESLSIFGLWNRHHAYANLAVWFGLFQTNIERNMHLAPFDFRATSFTSGYQFDPHIEMGYDYDFRNDTCTFEPFVTVDWIHNWQSPYKEYSKNPLKFFQQNLHSSMLRTEVGFRVYEEFEFKSWNLVLQETLSYLNKDTYSLGNWKGFLLGAPGTLVLDTLSDAEHFGSLAFSILFDPKKPKYPSGKLGYKGELGSSYRSHQITASTEWSF